MLRGLDSEVNRELSLLLPVADAWQPNDYLPDLTQPDWIEAITAFREKSAGLADGLLVVLVGGMVTEEALPSYSMAIDSIASGGNRNGAPTAWAAWTRGWTAEENRHGDLLNAYLRLSGRVDMRAVEITTHHLINNGFDPALSADPYKGLIYTAFQERATRVSHMNVGKIAMQQGEGALARICQKIAGDETRHETFYTRIMDSVFKQDPENALIAFATMMKRVIVMPGRRMFDGHDPDLFDHFAATAQRLGVYTVRDYSQIIEHLVRRWDIAHFSVSGPAARAQNYLCRQAERYLNFAEEAEKSLERLPVGFSWIHNRKA
ncbi:MAG: acyl-ACP desaturase [Phycisphaerae bacterium]|nr:acyl-ACP desaturase [Phycisphaerae bacterium]